MRAAAFLAGTVIAVGIYLTIAATFGLSVGAIGIGVLVIALVAGIGFVASSATSPSATSTPLAPWDL
jgi:hypothetical protein